VFYIHPMSRQRQCTALNLRVLACLALYLLRMEERQKCIRLDVTYWAGVEPGSPGKLCTLMFRMLLVYGNNGLYAKNQRTGMTSLPSFNTQPGPHKCDANSSWADSAGRASSGYAIRLKVSSRQKEGNLSCQKRLLKCASPQVSFLLSVCLSDIHTNWTQGEPQRAERGMNPFPTRRGYQFVRHVRSLFSACLVDTCKHT
jgi:hypothetical protein